LLGKINAALATLEADGTLKWIFNKYGLDDWAPPKSLSGHIPRSSLRSSDLLPFYHQYPAACCGDFLLKGEHVTRQVRQRRRTPPWCIWLWCK
jgi:hypothetical protein